MLPALFSCVMLVQLSQVSGYGAKGNFIGSPFFDSADVFPFVPAQAQMIPHQAIFPEIPHKYPFYQHEVSVLPAQPMWPNMHIHQMSFFPLDCDLPSHQNIHFLGSPFMNQNPWGQVPFQNQGQMKQMTFQNQGQWKQTAFQNQGQGLWKQTPIQGQSQNQWKQPKLWKSSQNVNMIGQWDEFPVTDQMLSQPAISNMAPKGAGFKIPMNKPKSGSKTFASSGFVPVQSRRLR